eukprot:s279_g33.t1
MTRSRKKPADSPEDSKDAVAEEEKPIDVFEEVGLHMRGLISRIFALLKAGCVFVCFILFIKGINWMGIPFDPIGDSPEWLSPRLNPIMGFVTSFLLTLVMQSLENAGMLLMALVGGGTFTLWEGIPWLFGIAIGAMFTE